MEYQTIRARIAATGLVCRGGFYPTDADAVPGVPTTLILVGDLGGRLWPGFESCRQEEADPLDNWTRRVLEPVAAELGAVVLYPFGETPHHPFQAWATKAEGLRAAPIGPLAHPEFGLWHSYRGALAFADRIDLPMLQFAHPCDTCAEKPCLTTCPVDAFDDAGFTIGNCISHLHSPGGAPCMIRGCLARRACPVGAEHAYSPDHQAFLAEWFVRAKAP